MLVSQNAQYLLGVDIPFLETPSKALLSVKYMSRVNPWISAMIVRLTA